MNVLIFLLSNDLCPFCAYYFIISVKALQLSKDFGNTFRGNILQNLITVEMQVRQNNDSICLNIH